MFAKRNKMKIKYAVYSTVGFCRTVNEDNYYLNGKIKNKTSANSMSRNSTRKSPALFAVCDGLGGESFGEEAAYLAVSSLKDYKETFQEDPISFLNEVNYRMQREQLAKDSAMGCTFASLSIDGEHVKVINLGDSRVYYYRDGVLKQLSKDHSEFQTLLDFGIVSAEEYYSNSSRNALTRCLGQDCDEVEPHIWESNDIMEGDTYLLCSDGLCGIVRGDDIGRILSTDESLLNKCEALVKKALDLKSDDNITVMLVTVESCKSSIFK